MRLIASSGTAPPDASYIACACLLERVSREACWYIGSLPKWDIHAEFAERALHVNVEEAVGIEQHMVEIKKADCAR